MITIVITITCVYIKTHVLQSRDREHRKSTGKQGLDASGNLYQYDNYDEVAMDTDSEGSPGEKLLYASVLFLFISTENIA